MLMSFIQIKSGFKLQAKLPLVFVTSTDRLTAAGDNLRTLFIAILRIYYQSSSFFEETKSSLNKFVNADVIQFTIPFGLDMR